MQDQPKYKDLRGSAFFEDRRVGAAGRRGHGRPRAFRTATRVFLTGKANGQPVAELPDAADAGAARARARALRHLLHALPRPDRATARHRRPARLPRSRRPSRSTGCARRPSATSSTCRRNGFGAMMDYTAQIPPADRWAIAAYVRALQLSPERDARRRAGRGPAARSRAPTPPRRRRPARRRRRLDEGDRDREGPCPGPEARDTDGRSRTTRAFRRSRAASRRARSSSASLALAVSAVGAFADPTSSTGRTCRPSSSGTDSPSARSPSSCCST